VGGCTRAASGAVGHCRSMAKVAPAEGGPPVEEPPPGDGDADPGLCGAKVNRTLLPPLEQALEPSTDTVGDRPNTGATASESAAIGGAHGVASGDSDPPSSPADGDWLLDSGAVVKAVVSTSKDCKKSEEGKRDGNQRTTMLGTMGRHVAKAEEYEALLSKMTSKSSKQAKLMSVQGVLFAFTFMMSTFETANR
jgi:hypothetical protein